MDDIPEPPIDIGRRRAIQYSGLLTAVSIAGCLGGSDAPAPDPITLDDQNQCEICGMIIADYPGPNGQIFYEDNEPDTHENPAWFDSVMGCMMPYYFDHQSLGWKVDVAYVTDYSGVDWEITTVRGQDYITSTVTSESFTNAEETFYVADSGIHGAMGPELIPFSSEDDAHAFAENNGGDVLEFDEITPSTIQSTGSDSHL